MCLCKRYYRCKFNIPIDVLVPSKSKPEDHKEADLTIRRVDVRYNTKVNLLEFHFGVISYLRQSGNFGIFVGIIGRFSTSEYYNQIRKLENHPECDSLSLSLMLIDWSCRCFLISKMANVTAWLLLLISVACSSGIAYFVWSETRCSEQSIDD